MKKPSSRLLDMCMSIPPIKPQNLLPVLIMLGFWVVLRFQGVAEDAAFVVAVVAAQAYLVWRNLPLAKANLDTVGSPPKPLLYGIAGITFAIALMQLWLGSPLFTQRVLTVLCVFFLMVMLLGVLRERDVMARIEPAMPKGEGYSAPVSLLRINAVMAALIIAVNEWLIFFETPGVWITVMPVLMLILHAVYWFMVLATLPPSDAEAA